MAFQDRINQFRAGLDQQQNHFNDAMGQVATYGQHYLEDKLGQHYENIEKTGGAVLSASLTAGSAYSKAKTLYTNIKNYKAAKGASGKLGNPDTTPPPGSSIEMKDMTSFVPEASKVDDFGLPVNERESERPVGADYRYDTKSGTMIDLDKPEGQQQVTEKDFTGELPGQYTTKPPMLQKISDEADDEFFAAPGAGATAKAALAGSEAITRTGRAVGEAPPAPQAPASLPSVAELKEAGGSGITKASTIAEPTPAPPSYTRPGTGFKIQSGGTGTAVQDAPTLSRPPEEAQATTTAKAVQRPAQQPAQKDTQGDILSDRAQENIVDKGTEPEEFEKAFPAPTAENLAKAKQQALPDYAPLEGDEDEATQAAAQGAKAAATAGEGLAAVKSIAGGAAEVTGAAVGGKLAQSSNVAESDVGLGLQGAVAAKSTLSLAQRLKNLQGGGSEAAEAPVGSDAPASLLDNAVSYAKTGLKGAMDGVTDSVTAAARSTGTSMGLTTGTMDGVGAALGAAGDFAMTAVPIIGDLAGAGMLIYGIVKDIEERKKNPTPQVSAPAMTATEQAGGVDVKALGGSQNTGQGIV